MPPAVLTPWPTPLLPARLLRRYQRFLADVELPDGRVTTVHCPNPGRMTTCLPDQGQILLSDRRSPKRKLDYTWELSRRPESWVVVNTGVSNQLAADALRRGLIPSLPAERVAAEVRCLGSRLDFGLDDTTFVEVKQTTLVVGGEARFPDAVSERGRRHLEVLSQLAGSGFRAVALYIVGREDGERFAPAADIDPAYAQAFAQARRAGVEVLVYGCRVSPQGVALSHPLPIVP